MLSEEERMQSIKRNIALLSENEQDVYRIIRSLYREDWEAILLSTHNAKVLSLPCVVCKRVCLLPRGPLCGMCPKCRKLEENKIRVLCGQRSRAKTLGLSYSLTLREWYQTVDYFHGKCAYCLEGDYECLEHFIPLTSGGGTTKGNCLPSCQACNRRKKDHHPDDLAHRFPNGTIERVHAYLAQF